MSTLHTDSQGRIRKRSREKDVVAAIERINSRTIIIEYGVLRPDIRVAPFDFIYHAFHENGWMSLFDAGNIYPRLVYEFYTNLKIGNMHQMSTCLETKVRGTFLHINAELISKVTSIPISHALGTPFLESMTPPSREQLMSCFDPRGAIVWEESKNSIPIG
jgi:hypothetical protein